MRICILILALLGCVCSLSRAEDAPLPACIVIGEGIALLGDDPIVSQEEAIWEAKRDAVEQAFGQKIRARQFGRDHALEESEVWSSAEGFVQHWELIPGSRHIITLNGSPVVSLKIRATVAPLTSIHRLSDLADVYSDMARPRIRVQVEGESPTHTIANSLIAGLRSQGFEIATDERADITLACHLTLTPTIHLGDSHTPYGIGNSLASCRSQISARLISHASQEVLLFAHSEGAGQSFQSDTEAAARAAGNAGDRLLSDNEALFVNNLLLRWAEERIEGYVACIQVSGLDSHRSDLLLDQIRNQRGFRRTLEETHKDTVLTLRFLTRSDFRALRQRLRELNLDGVTLRIQPESGATIVCTANRAPRPATNSQPHRTVRKSISPDGPKPE